MSRPWPNVVEQGIVIAIVGAESTGKTTLAFGLTQALLAEGVNATMVPEVLREFCDDRGRTPYPHEQVGIARDQTQRLVQSTQTHDVVVADTTALMTAVYSDHLFNDQSLYAQALIDHAFANLTLLTALDLPWQADGLQRDGAHVREPVDDLIRQHLLNAELPFSVVAGQGVHRLDQALLVVRQSLSATQRAQENAVRPRWRWVCERCDDGDCEQHWLPRA
ncbi:ATP-binding protein [Aquabacterium sp.]|uniref:ATP-binding protein n=1 Tax=Aquabacterium sp. TaxID=1872578 RepID=UPI002489B3D0|nr:ATP-binding protein [Aquabacterium sp.]MDI1258968.1 ATP-binding protein [Aquabacterium sp.]